ncbi:MAG: carbohydrate porin [Rhodanobacter sp.]|jgi:porin
MIHRNALSLVFAGIILTSTLPAVAQDSDAAATSSPQTAKRATKAVKSKRRWDGVVPVLDLVGNSATNPVGGVRRGHQQSGWIKIGATFDLGTLWGWKNTTLDVYAAWFGGGNLARSDIGNSISSQQTWRPVAGGRLTQFSINHSFANGLSITAGRVALNTYFNKSRLNCYFMSNAMCLTPYGPISDIGITAYPNSSWGGLARFDFSKHLYVQSGWFDYNNNLNLAHKNGLDFDTEKGTGALSSTEFGYESRGGKSEFPGAYRVGFYHNTDPGKSPYFDAQGASATLNHKPLAALTGSRTAWYAMVDQTVWQGQGGRSLQVFARGFANTGNPQAVKQFGAIGAVLTGTFAGRSRDSLNIFISDTRFDNQEVKHLADLRTIHGGYGAPHANEYITELSYGIAVARGVRVLPNLQYIVNPDPIYAATRTKNIPNALVVGLRMDIHVAQLMGW